MTQVKYRLAFAATLLGEQFGMNLGKDASTGDGHILEKLIELFVVVYGKTNVTRCNTNLTIVTSGFPS